ncbi:MAG: hypothetical protein GF370_02635 [Candidatus Nealsonbacteria bacterium]|nr:hypothetical protein [Candidatus Nealsonbacteria bacterium]
MAILNFKKRFCLVLALTLCVAFLIGGVIKAENIDISIETIVGEPSPPPVTPPENVTVPPYRLSSVILRGRTSPSAFLTILKAGQVAGTLLANDSGLFTKEISGLEGGDYEFAIWAEDGQNRYSQTLRFPLEVLGGTKTTVSGIFLSPTIEIQDHLVERGESIIISGETFPGSEINILVSPSGEIKKTNSDSNGEWSYNLDTSLLERGNYQVKANSLASDGRQSEFSQLLYFSVIVKTPFFPGKPLPPGELEIFSSTHPEEDDWYRQKGVTFLWELADEIEATGFSYILDKKPETIPDNTSEGTLKYVDLNIKEDGVWYFHVKAERAEVWGPVSHYRVQVDTDPPVSFSSQVDEESITEEERALLRFTATDDLSGVDYYQIKLKGKDTEEIFVERESPYQLPKLKAGRYSILVKVWDRAGNFREKEVDFEVVSSGVEIPVTGKPIWQQALECRWLIGLLIFLLVVSICFVYRKLKEKRKEEKKISLE